MKKLLFSLHDVTPRHFDRLRRIDKFLDETGIGSRYAMLVVPDFWKKWPIEAFPEFGSWLRSKADAGVEMVLHGFTHIDEAAHAGLADRFKATFLTAREGEFLGLDREQATSRLIHGRRILENLTGQTITSFIAPAWLYGDAAKTALHDLGFTIAEDHWSVWNPVTRQVFVHSPVISYASRSRPRVVSSLVWSRIATGALAPLDTVRVALHPHDLDVDALVRELKRVMSEFLGRREPIQYRDLAAA
jgi:predicted deacetylase